MLQGKKPKYRCIFCDKKSNPESDSEKRSMSMHVKKQHPDKIPDDADPSEFWVRITENPEEKVRERPSKSENVVYIVQAKFDSKFEAESEMKSFLQQKPDLEDYTFLQDKYIFIRCSENEKAQAVANMVDRYIHPINIEIHEERKESESDKQKKSGGLSGIKNLISGNKSQEVKENPKPQEPEPKNKYEIIGHSVSTDNYQHFQRSEADASDMESLMMARQRIAEGEGLQSSNPMKWVVAIIVLLIGLAVAYGVFQAVVGPGGLPIPGGATIP